MFRLSFRRCSDFWKRGMFTRSRFEKLHSSQNLKVTASRPVVESFLPLFESIIRILQLCPQYCQWVQHMKGFLSVKFTSGADKASMVRGRF